VRAVVPDPRHRVQQRLRAGGVTRDKLVKQLNYLPEKDDEPAPAPKPAAAPAAAPKAAVEKPATPAAAVPVEKPAEKPVEDKPAQATDAPKQEPTDNQQQQ